MESDTMTESDRESVRMRELAESVAADLTAETEFDPVEWAGEFVEWADTEEGNGQLVEDVDTALNAIPTDIRELVDMDEFREDPETAVNHAFEQWRDTATETVLDIRGEVSFLSDGFAELSELTVVLGTGGPHVEVTFDYAGRGHVRAYDWWMAGDTSIPVDLGGHPLANLFELYADVIGR